MLHHFFLLRYACGRMVVQCLALSQEGSRFKPLQGPFFVELHVLPLSVKDWQSVQEVPSALDKSV